MRRGILAICLFFSISLWLMLSHWATAALPPSAQSVKTNKSTEPRPQSKSRVYLLHSDVLYFDESISKTAQFLVGNVRFRHDGVLMFCDSALFYEATNSFDAYGNVRMVQGDTLTLTSDILYYDGMEQLAKSRHNVVLTHRETVLYTDSLDYDRLYDLGYYFDGGRLVDGENQLTSDWGEYSPTTREAVFNYNVRMVNPLPPAPADVTIISDTLHYSTLTKVAHLVGPSNVDSGTSHCYTENGFYDTNTEDFYLLDRSILTDQGKILTGDSICWNKKDSVGQAFFNAIYTDEINKNMMTGNYCYYDDKTGYSMGTDSAQLIDFSQKDTMYAHADTFKVFVYNYRTDSIYRNVHGYHHVRAYRVDMQAVCDSLVFTGQDTVVTMYKDPILWQQNQQIVGEEIKAFLNDSTVDSIQVLRQALSSEQIDESKYNQVAGQEMHSYFRDGKMYMIHVIRNTLVNYYPFDSDSILIGMNHLESTELKMYMDDEQKVDHIWTPAADGTLYPLLMIPPGHEFLPGFAWFGYIRPRDKNDIWVWRAKTAGTELKPIVRRNPPLQKLKKKIKTQ